MERDFSDPVRERVKDAQLLWAEGRREGALLMALVAVIVRARQDFPPPTPDGQAFARFLESWLQIRLSVEYREKLWPVDQILYRWLRFELAHKGAIPVEISFMDAAPPGELVVRAGGAPEFELLLSPAWFDRLLEWASS